MAQAAASTCEICTGGPGEHYCQQCDQLFCVSCKLSHLRAKSCKNHTFLSGPNINQEKKLLCTEHEESFLFYCHDCETPVCRICTVKKHCRHLMTDLTESTLKLKSELVRNIESTVATSNFNLSKIETDTKAYREEVKAVIKTITEEGNNWKKLIDKKVNSLVKQVQDGEQNALHSMSALTLFNRELLDNCQQWQNNVKEMETTTDVSLLQKLKQIKTDVDKIEFMHIPVAPSVSYRNRKSSGTNIDTLFGELQLRPSAVQTRYRYTCGLCKNEQVSTIEPEQSSFYSGRGLSMACNNSECGLYNHSWWHGFRGKA